MNAVTEPPRATDSCYTSLRRQAIIPLEVDFNGTEEDHFGIEKQSRFVTG